MGMWFSRNATRPRYRVAEAAELHLHRRSLVLEAAQNLDEAAQRQCVATPVGQVSFQMWTMTLLRR